MRNIKTIFILLSLVAFSSYVFAQTPVKDPTKKFLRAKKHLKNVAKETKKIEKTLSESDLKEAVEPIEQIPSAENIQLTPPENEPPAAVTEIKTDEEVKPVEEEDLRGWFLSLEANTNMDMIRANDTYGRQLKLYSSVGFGGYTSVGFRFGNHFAIVGDYEIDNIKFNNFDTYIVSQSSKYLMSGRLGPRFYLTKRFHMEILAGLRQHYVVYPTSLTNINIERFNHGSVTIGLNYSIIQGQSFLMSGKTEFDIYLSTTRSAFKTSTGIGATTDLKLGIPIRERSSIYLNMGIGYINLKPNIASQYGIFGFGGLGVILAN
ncbi:MAG: hypothetical protein NTY22_04175 [Proteobacteria bacterium]|nr:hypothetical protein [Pseudomonadota bacterium]